MILVHRQDFYEKLTGIEHELLILFIDRGVYEVRVDDEFYSTAESRNQAYDELLDIISLNNWRPIKPYLI